MTFRQTAGAVLAGLIVQMLTAATPLIIAHRGASGHRPEHTIEAYSLAIDMGADVIEPDLVCTKDGVLIARHENDIGGTTDVARKFPARKRTKTIDGQTVTGWFTEDFTWAEIRSLRAVERLPFRSHDYDGRFSIPRFEAVVELAAARGRELGRQIAVYPELKHPEYFRGIGLPLEDRLLDAARAHGLTSKTSSLLVQSFDPASLRRLRPRTAVRLVQLLDESADASRPRLAEIAGYADGVAPHKRLIVPARPDGSLGPPTNLVGEAHALGLFVHVWTMRSEPAFLARAYDGDPAREYRQFAGLGVDGIFTDVPDAAVSALRAR